MTADECGRSATCGFAQPLLHLLLRKARGFQKRGDVARADTLYVAAEAIGTCLGSAFQARLAFERATSLATSPVTRNMARDWWERAYTHALEADSLDLAKRILRERFWLAYRYGSDDELFHVARCYPLPSSGHWKQEDVRMHVALASVFVRRAKPSRADSVLGVVLENLSSVPSEDLLCTIASVVWSVGRAEPGYRKCQDKLNRLQAYALERGWSRACGEIAWEKVDLLELEGSHHAVVAASAEGLRACPDMPDTLKALLYLKRGNAYFRLGQVEKALEDYAEASRLSKERPPLHVAAVVNQAYALGVLGKAREGIEVCSRARLLIDEKHSPGLVAEVLSTLGVLHALDGNEEMAIRMHKEAGTLALRSADTLRYLEALANWAACLHRKGDHALAESLYITVAELAQKRRDTQARLLALTNMAAIRARNGDYETAERLFASVRDSLGEALPELRWRVLYQEALTFLARGDYGRARNLLVESVSLIEKMRNPLSREDFKLGFLSQRYEVYAELVGCLLALSAEDAACLYQAFAVAEKNKARVLIELFGRDPADSSVSGPEVTNFAELARYGRALSDLLAQELEEDAVLLEYVVAPTAIHVFIFDKRRRLQARSLSISEAALRERISVLYGLLSRPRADTWQNALQFSEVATELYDALLPDILPESPPREPHVIIVPDGILGYLPFEVLFPKLEGQQLAF
ncbi:MAG: tetratricopeptide repeat protein [candidate division KSB1 bacterium]|nr:tetratricopeptide repeat protein [candidate division KSB1 bacterium]